MIGLLACTLAAGLLPALQDGADGTSTYGNAPRRMAAFSSSPAYRELFVTVPDYFGPGRETTAPASLEEIRLGLITTLEGRGAAIGVAMRNGILLAVEQQNARGGHRGIPYRLVERNDQGPWGASSNEMAHLAYDQGVWAVFGSAEAASIHIALRVALKTRTMILSTGCSDPTLLETGIPWIVRNFPDDRQNALRLAQYMFEDQGHRRVAVVRVNNKYGRMGVMEYMDASRRLRRPPPVETRFLAGETDFAVPVDRVLKSGAEAVCFWGEAEEGGLLLRQLREAGFDGPFYGCDLLANERFLSAAGPAAEGSVLVTPFDPDRSTPAVEQFRADFEARFGAPPDCFAAYAFDGARMLFEAIDEVGLNRVRIRDALYRVERYEGVAGVAEFDAPHNNVRGVYLTRVEDGRLQPVWTP